MTEKEIVNQEPMTRRAHRKMKRQGKVAPDPTPVAEQPVEGANEPSQKSKGFFRRERKKNKPLTTSRTAEQEKTAALGRFLNKAILGVSILLIIVFIAIFYF